MVLMVYTVKRVRYVMMDVSFFTTGCRIVLLLAGNLVSRNNNLIEFILATDKAEINTRK